MVKAKWEFDHFVECNAPGRFCWSYWSDIANWDDPPARFSLEGPFADGSRITTELPGQTLVSVIRNVQEGRAATIEVGLPNALFSFHWRFDDLEVERTRIGQRLVLSGGDAAIFLGQAKVMGKNAPEGLKKTDRRNGTRSPERKNDGMGRLTDDTETAPARRSFRANHRCVSRTQARACGAVPEMGVGLPKSACRSRLQTASVLLRSKGVVVND